MAERSHHGTDGRNVRSQFYRHDTGKRLIQAQSGDAVIRLIGT
jgi:hypothetical protein